MRNRLAVIASAWNRFWFTRVDPTTLAAVRICTGLVLLGAYIPCCFDLFSYVGPNAWVDAKPMRIPYVTIVLECEK